MRRMLFTGISAALVATLAACGGGSSDDAATATPVTPSAVAATPTKAASPSPQATASAQATPSVPAPTSSPTAPAETATATAPPPTNPPANQPAATPATPVPPTATPPPASTNPLAATIGVTAAGSSYFWAPASVKVAPGATVTWTWSGNVPHNVEGPGFGLAPTDYKNADTVSFTFSSAGTYNFSCGTHPTMRGKVVVE